MTDPFRRRMSSRAIAALALSAAISACDFIPEGGYDKTPNRVEEALAIADAPAPPPYVASAAGATAAVPQLASGAPAGVTQEMVDAGAQQYSTVCAACHGPAGAGTAAAPALNDAEWLNIAGEYEQIVTTITNGVPAPRQFAAPMPPRGGGPFTDDQVRQIGAYVFALSHQAGS